MRNGRKQTRQLLANGGVLTFCPLAAEMTLQSLQGRRPSNVLVTAVSSESVLQVARRHRRPSHRLKHGPMPAYHHDKRSNHENLSKLVEHADNTPHPLQVNFSKRAKFSELTFAASASFADCLQPLVVKPVSI